MYIYTHILKEHQYTRASSLEISDKRVYAYLLIYLFTSQHFFHVQRYKM